MPKVSSKLLHDALVSLKDQIKLADANHNFGALLYQLSQKPSLLQTLGLSTGKFYAERAKDLSYMNLHDHPAQASRDAKDASDTNLRSIYVSPDADDYQRNPKLDVINTPNRIIQRIDAVLQMTAYQN